MRRKNEHGETKEAHRKIGSSPRTRRRLYAIFILQFLFFSAAAFAVQRQQATEQSTDDALLQSLDAHAGDDYDRALLGEPEKPKTGPKDHEEPEKALKQQPGPAEQEAQQADPLLQAAKGMAEVRDRLAKGKSDAITQTVQRQVVADLQKIIDEAKKSGKCCGQSLSCNCKSSGKPGSGGKSSSGANSRASNQGPARESSPKASREVNDRVAEQKKREHEALMERYRIALPERERVKMSASPSDYFLPEYEREIEDYFRRLSSGRAASERE